MPNNAQPTNTESHYVRLACAAVSRGDDDLAARYLELAEEARRERDLRAAVLRGLRGDIMTTTPDPLYFCEGEDCPGLAYRATRQRHPLFCLSADQFRLDFDAAGRDDNRPPPPSALASILRILDELRVLIDANDRVCADCAEVTS